MGKATAGVASAAVATSSRPSAEATATNVPDAVEEAARIEAIVEQRVAARLAEIAAAAPQPVAAVTRRPVKNLDLFAPMFGSTDGYGNVAQHVAIELEKLGVHVRVVGGSMRCDPMAPEAYAIFERSKTDTAYGDAILFLGHPCGPQGSGGWIMQHDRPAFGLSMFEADDIPGVWAQGIARVHEVWTPSAHSTEIFRRHAPAYVGVETIPLGIDAKALPATRRQRGKRLRVLHHSSHANENRKGVDLAIAAFVAAFPGRDDVELVIHSAFGPVTLPQSDPRVRLEIGRYDEARIAALYDSCDVLLYPSRGEGFGLVPLEAMATGMPAIYADSTGMHEYAEFGLTVSARPMPSRIGVGRGGVDVWAVEAPWYEPSHDELVARLREVDTDYDAVQGRAMAQAAEIAERFSWAAMAQAIKARLDNPTPLRRVDPAQQAYAAPERRGVDISHILSPTPLR